MVYLDSDGSHNMQQEQRLAHNKSNKRKHKKD